MPTAAELTVLALSLKIALAATALVLPPAFAAAWLLARPGWPGKALLDALVLAPLVLPPVVVGYLLLITLGTRAPLGAWLLETLGLRLIFTAQGAVLAAAVMAFPLAVRAIRLSLEAVDAGLVAAARTLGATRLDAFLSITLPLAAPGLLAGGVMAFAASLGEFGATITFASNVAGETRTLPLAIYTATQTPDGDASALRLVGLSMALALAALLAAETLHRRALRWLGRSA